MTRIIAGFAGGLTLAVPKSGTRPTSDRVREAVFSALEARDAIEGSRVLDLYAGSGALGLEAASRGAAEVTLVEKAPDAARTARSNAQSLRARTRSPLPIEVVARSAQSFLDTAIGDWDLVLIDPPYDIGGPELSRALQSLVPHLAPDAVVVLERAARSPEPAWPAGLELQRRKDYGETAVFYTGRTR